MKKLTFIAIATLGMSIPVLADDAKLPPDSTKTGVTYAADIKPIFDDNCLKCHDSAKKPKGELALDSLAGVLKGGKEGAVVIPGDSAKSELVLRIAHVGDDPMQFMPRGKHAEKLSDEQIGLIRAWIDQGAK